MPHTVSTYPKILLVTTCPKAMFWKNACASYIDAHMHASFILGIRVDLVSARASYQYFTCSVCLSVIFFPRPNARWQHSHRLRPLPDTNYIKSSRSMCGVTCVSSCVCLSRSICGVKMCF